MNAPATPKGHRTKEKIINASGKVFAKAGYGSAGVARICGSAGIAVGGFYRYFTGKEEVMDAIVDNFSAGLAEKLSALPIRASLSEEAVQLINTVFTFLADRQEFYQSIREAEFVNEKTARFFYTALTQAIAARFKKYNFAGADLETAVYALVGMITFFAAKQTIWETKAVNSCAVQDIAHLFINGVSADKTLDFEAIFLKAGRAELKSEVPVNETTGERLLKAAEFVFGKNGYAQAGVADIARQAGYATGTFYTCFDSKKTALDKLVVHLRDQLILTAMAFSKDASDRRETEALSMLALFSFIAEHPYGYKILREAEFVDFKLAGNYYLFILENYTAGLKQYSKPGEFSITDYSRLSLAMMGIGHLLGLKYVLWNGKKPDRATLKRMLRQIFYGFEYAR